MQLLFITHPSPSRKRKEKKKRTKLGKNRKKTKRLGKNSPEATGRKKFFAKNETKAKAIAKADYAIRMLLRTHDETKELNETKGDHCVNIISFLKKLNFETCKERDGSKSEKEAERTRNGANQLENVMTMLEIPFAL